MIKEKLLIIACVLFVAFETEAMSDRKTIDEGGSGPFKAEVCSESTLPNFVLYKPQNMLQAVEHEGRLPLLIFANGGCNDTSLPHERMLNDLASYGYVVIALGEMQERIDDRELHKSPNEDMIRAIDWANKQNKNKKSEYYRSLDMEHIALGGQSCGGAQVLSNCGDPRVKTCILFNSGIGNMEMSGATKASLKNLHGPILYIIGGEEDVAYQNAIIDYESINTVPVAFANQLRVGHGGTFHEQYGGSFSHMLRNWLSWQFKDQRQNIDVFVRNRLNDFPDWTMKAKNFASVNEPFRTQEIQCKSRDGKNIWGMAYIPNTKEEKKAMVVMAHGFNSSHQETQAYAECLAMRGIASYIFDFCGGGNQSKSEGKTTEMTIYTEKENVEDITRTVKSWDFVDSSRMALLGCSQGGLVAAFTAAANPDLFKSLILVYPALLIPETAPRMLAQFDSHEGKTMDVMGMQLGRIYYEKINGMNILDTIGAFKGKTFIVYGDKDGVVAGGTLEKAKNIYENCEVKVIPNGTHGFPDYLHHAQSTQGIVNFLTRELAGVRQQKREFPANDSAQPDVHDPVMAYENNKYYMFTTGFGIGMLSSDDMVNWKIEKAPLDPIPSWAKEVVPSYKGHTWAPDVQKVGDRWYLYYSCSTFGKNISAIGVAANNTLDPKSPDYKWEDQGMVISSQPRINDWNAIDPNLILDKKGNPWLVFGSFWDGIQLVQLKKDMKTPIGKPRTIARRRNPEVVAHNQPEANTNAIEAPFITYHDEYYYLFVSFDFCCKGLSSNYKTAVGRSKKITGPYLDMKGNKMLNTGGSILVGESDHFSGVGHCGVYEFGDKWYFVAHGYDKQKNGASKLYLRELQWTDGWPSINE